MQIKQTNLHLVLYVLVNKLSKQLITCGSFFLPERKPRLRICWLKWRSLNVTAWLDSLMTRIRGTGSKFPFKISPLCFALQVFVIFFVGLKRLLWNEFLIPYINRSTLFLKRGFHLIKNKACALNWKREIMSLSHWFSVVRLFTSVVTVWVWCGSVLEVGVTWAENWSMHCGDG